MQICLLIVFGGFSSFQQGDFVHWSDKLCCSSLQLHGAYEPIAAVCIDFHDSSKWPGASWSFVIKQQHDVIHGEISPFHVPFLPYL